MNGGNEIESPLDGVRFQLAGVVKRCDNLNGAITFVEDVTFEGVELESFASQACRLMRLSKRVHIQNARKALTMYSGRKMGRDFYVDMCWLMAAGYSRFRVGKEIENAFRTINDRWVGVIVTDIQPAPMSSNKTHRVEVHFRIITGIFCALKFSQWMPQDYVTKIMAKSMGVPKYNRAHVKEIVGMVCVVLFRSDGYRQSMIDLQVPAAAFSYNRQLYRSRAKPCDPWGYEWTCYQCPVGYDDDRGKKRCVRATHPHSYTYQECPHCGKQSWFDLRSRSSLCIRCNVNRFKH